MGYAVLHMEKTAGTDSGMSAHIERTTSPKNADSSRTPLNRELICFPKGVKNRTEAIQHRLDTAGLTRKIGKNQVRAIRVLLTGSPQDMKLIEQNGRLNKWCDDNLEWLRETFGKENIVSAVLHMDETTPHIHATLVPIVTGERRKAKVAQQQNGKKKYKKKNPGNTRLCADDVMNRIKLKQYQDSYAAKMQDYGLERGIEGSEARHMATSQYYRELLNQSNSIQENIGILLQDKEQAEKELSKIKGEIKSQNLKSTLVNAASSAAEGLGSLLGSQKMKRQQQEIDRLASENRGLKEEIKLLNRTIQTNETEHRKALDRLKDELKKIYDLFPVIREFLRVEKLCRLIGFGEAATKKLLAFKPLKFDGKIYSPEFKRHFQTEQSIAQVEKHPQREGELRLTIDGLNDSDWFRKKRNEGLQALGIKLFKTPLKDPNKKQEMKL
ncbi:MobV family relaxase [Odoribacter lunatus]|uniref:MobV family relaxase n=1 Tax=Odoribacter lunatus TaxID=2941335 RepID=UPI00203DB70F|nr:MobV family relaxase [Odoribacter lunatus]